MISVTPFAWQSSNSLTFIRREALVMSGVLAPMPAQKRFMPPPVPVDSMIGAANCAFEREKFSATSFANG
ncbi:hypothetical protein D3C83_189060 [compost metagenome]